MRRASRATSSTVRTIARSRSPQSTKPRPIHADLYFPVEQHLTGVEKEIPMSYRFYASAITLAIVVTGTVSAQKPWKPGRTPDGQPDLQGIWTNNTLTPLERPAQFQGKPVLTPSEAAEYEKQAVAGPNRDRRDSNPEVDVT